MSHKFVYIYGTCFFLYLCVYVYIYIHTYLHVCSTSFCVLWLCLLKAMNDEPI